MKEQQPGLEVRYKWSDQGTIEVIVYVSNGAFCGTSNVYLVPGQLSTAATELAGFPLDLDDKRSITLGTFDPTYAGGGVSMSFRCTDRSGHALVEIVLQSEGGVQSVRLTVPVVPSAVDEFVSGLGKIESTRGRAALPTGTLQTR